MAHESDSLRIHTRLSKKKIQCPPEFDHLSNCVLPITFSVLVYGVPGEVTINEYGDNTLLCQQFGFFQKLFAAAVCRSILMQEEYACERPIAIRADEVSIDPSFHDANLRIMSS